MAAAKSRLDDPRFRPVIRLVNLLGRLQERNLESFRKLMETLRADLSGRLSFELKDGRRFIIIGPLAISDSTSNSSKRIRSKG